MERAEVLKQINEIFIDTLDDEDIVIDETSQASDVDGWDSLTHIMLVVAIEKNFKIKFTSQEILSWKDVGGMINSIIDRIA